MRGEGGPGGEGVPEDRFGEHGSPDSPHQLLESLVHVEAQFGRSLEVGHMVGVTKGGSLRPGHLWRVKGGCQVLGGTSGVVERRALCKGEVMGSQFLRSEGKVPCLARGQPRFNPQHHTGSPFSTVSSNPRALSAVPPPQLKQLQGGIGGIAQRGGCLHCMWLTQV